MSHPTANAVANQAAHIDPNPNRILAKDCADRIAAALKDATEADETWAPKLKALQAHNDLTVSDADWADVHDDQQALQKVASDYLDKSAIPEGKPQPR
ncbi:hypothetical protein JJV70_20530 [Streptomyces sp. JJ66]|uniref:hypothetical protein n=1 Tax=Streptomyces sp. JJ66 TaxID=2803843 RepID=UPI001C5727BE|nr:hypothetical protein [Streptomyces sp. JJ66]MBW1604446.1 hypothetical protein [Streptomyces sp. JJ66]